MWWVINNQSKKGLLMSVGEKKLKSDTFDKATSKNVVVSCTFFVF